MAELRELLRARFGRRFAGALLCALDDCHRATALTVHPTLVTRAAGGWATCRVGEPGAPSSEADWLVLQCCRAAADFVVTTGENCRREGGLQVSMQGRHAAALRRWRAERQTPRRSVEPRPVLLTRSLPRLLAAMPGVLSQAVGGTKRGSPPLVFTPAEVEDEARSALRGQEQCEAEVVVLPAARLNMSSILRHLRAEAPGAAVSLEAGPSSTSGLYGRGCGDVGVLVVTEYRPAAEAVPGQPARPPPVCQTLLPKADMEAAYELVATASHAGGAVPGAPAEEASPGTWTFRLFCQSAAAGARG